MCVSHMRIPTVEPTADANVGTGSLDGEVVGACTNNTIKVKIVDA